MTLLKRISNSARLLKGSILALAAVGLVLPGASVAQSSVAARGGLADGTYLFGQSPTPDQIGATYAVLSVQGNQTVGAFYQPRSSYDCFSGDILPNQLALNIVDSYDQTVHPYTMALTSDSVLAAGGAASAYTLEGFHRIETLSPKDHEMLSVCQSDFAQ